MHYLNTVFPHYLAVHSSILLAMSIQNFKIPPKKSHAEIRVFNEEDKHTLLDPFTVIPTLQFSPIAGDIWSPITAIGEGAVYVHNEEYWAPLFQKITCKIQN